MQIFLFGDLKPDLGFYKGSFQRCKVERRSIGLIQKFLVHISTIHSSILFSSQHNLLKSGQGLYVNGRQHFLRQKISPM